MGAEREVEMINVTKVEISRLACVIYVERSKRELSSMTHRLLT